MMMRRAKAKKNAYQFGQFAETFSCWRLRLWGYKILERGYRQSTGEIDIIARRGNILAFIEVKARSSYDDAIHALGPTQRRRIERTAQVFLSNHPELATLNSRFDLIIVQPWCMPVHLSGAWMVGE